MNFIRKTIALLNKETSQINSEPQQRFQSVLKNHATKRQSLQQQKPGITQTQEAFAKAWRKNNTLKVV